MTATTVRVPATSANLGPGFDVLGIALDLANEVSVSAAGSWAVTVKGEGAGELAEDETNLVVASMKRVAEAAGRPLEPMRVECTNRIPVGRGLGSSAAAIVGGLVAANEVLEQPLGRDELLGQAAALEGHGDNVAAALLGGFTIFYHSQDGQPRALALAPAFGLSAVVVIPAQPLLTTEARGVLPSMLSYEDAKFQMARVALMALAVFEGRAELLAEAAADRMHQPARRQLEVGYDAAERALLEAGALAVSLSGAGPSVFGWVHVNEADNVRQRVADALDEGAPGAPKVMALAFDRQGAIVCE